MNDHDDLTGGKMRTLAFPDSLLVRAHKVFLSCGLVSGSLGLLAGLSAILSESPLPPLILLLAALIVLLIGMSRLHRLYDAAPVVQEGKELDRRLKKVAAELAQAWKNPLSHERIPAIQHRLVRIQAQWDALNVPGFWVFLRVAIETGRRRAIWSSLLMAACGMLAACCLGSYRISLPGEPGDSTALAVNQMVDPPGSHGSTPQVQATATRTLTTTPLPEPTRTQPPTPSPSQTSSSTPTATHAAAPRVIPGASCLSQDSWEEAEVMDVLDGDTIEVRLLDGGSVQRVRYIGIDAPEPGAPFATEAASANSQLVEGQAVLLFRDVSETDIYGRLLRYVVAGDIFVNYALVQAGLATAINYPPDEACAAIFRQAESEARDAQAGWYAPGLMGSPGGEDSSPPQGAGGNPAGCSASYPDICIPPPPPDLDCADLSARRFRVLPPDPHRLDGDGDGVGCESN